MIGLFKGLHATISHILTRKVTVQYPEQRRQLPERSRGLIRLRLRPDSYDPRCISCTFCEQICPATAIKVIHGDEHPGKVWTLDGGAGPMLDHLREGAAAVGGNGWRDTDAGKASPHRGCLAESLLESDAITPLSLAKTARRDGVLLSRAYSIATFYEQLGPGAPEREAVEPTPATGITVDGCPPILLGNHGRVDPESIDAYSQNGGYKGITGPLLEMTPDEAVGVIADSGLRGRGGSGKPTARKWQQAAAVDSRIKYIVCNADEGDRDSFKDRSLLENNPHAVIEGMMVAGYATGATHGIIYMDADFALARERVLRAVEQARDRGILGDGLQGTGYAFSIEVVGVPRAFIGGEETALIATLENRRPMPEVRPPFPSVSGIRNKPTVVENAETLATVPWIINNGAEAFREIGSPGSPGTKLYTLSGQVERPGLYEATMDTSLKKLVEGSAGGFSGEARAALVGGIGGGFLSPGLFDIPLDFDAMAEAGGDLSSGAIRVLGRDDCVVETVRRCLQASSRESCGKCTPCRVGTRRLEEVVGRICNGETWPGDLELAADLGRDIADSAFCDLGRGSVRPLLTALNFFHDEFVQHAEDKRCSSGRCSF